jgi:hypothetical protein
MAKKKTRPYATLYYTDARGGLPVSQGHPKSDVGSRKGAGWQVFALRKYRRVEIVDTATGLLVEALSITVEGKISHNVECAGQVSRGYQWRQKAEAARRKALGWRGRK